MPRNHVTLLLAITALVPIGCAGTAGTDDPTEPVAQTWQALTGYHVTTGSETAVTVGTTSNFNIAYNAVDPTHIVFPTSTTRHVSAGASEMGWAECLVGLCLSGTIRPPAGWSVLWSDPGATSMTSGSANYVFTSTLAVPAQKMPPNYIDGELDKSGLPTNFAGSYIGGICVARSTDGGGTFHLAASDCLQRTSTAYPYGIFYDGTTMLSGAGRVYVASHDVTDGIIDVYMATSPTGAFARMPSPFPSQLMSDHARMAMDGLGEPYIMSVTIDGNLLVSRYTAGSSYTGKWSTPVVVGSGVATDPGVTLSDRSLRMGPQYGMAVGLTDDGKTSELRVIYTVSINNTLHIHGTRCTTNMATCTQEPSWQTDAWVSDQFNPVIASASKGPPGPGRTGVFEISFHSRDRFPGGNNVEILSGQFYHVNGSAAELLTARFIDPQVPCPDKRGFFGDYDGLALNAYFGTEFARAYTDSTGGTCTMQMYTASPQNVAVAYVPF
jgi:hypothetical protein